MVQGGTGDHLFELRIVQRNGKPLPEVEHEGKVYAVGESGEQVVVQVRNMKSTPELVKAALTVDGKDAGYSKKITEPMRWNSFDGFWVSPLEKKAFIFSKPTVVDQGSVLRGEHNTGASASNPSSVGRIRVRFLPATFFPCPGLGCDRCQFLGHEIAAPSGSRTRTRENGSGGGEGGGGGGDDGGSLKGSESVMQAAGKKFFNSPSLCVAAGASMPRTLGTKRLQHACELPHIPSSTLVLFCETADTLFMRGVLRREKTEHMALLTPAMRKAFKIPEPEPVPEPKETPEAGVAAAPAAIAAVAGPADAIAAPPDVVDPAPAPAPQELGASHPEGGLQNGGCVGEGQADKEDVPLAKKVKREVVSEVNNALVKESQEARLAGAEVEEVDDELAVLRVPKPIPVVVDCDTLQ